MPNDTERAQWVDNDEGLYNWWKSSRQSKRAFIRENRAEIDGAISRVTGGERPAHYLAYGPDAGQYPRNPSPYGGGHAGSSAERYGARLRGRAGQCLLPR